MLSPPQAAIILQVDEDWLKKQRQKQSKPTNEEDDQPLPFCKMGEGKNAAVRYRLGDVRKHLASRRVINTHGGRICYFSSFADFMARGRIEDVWIFAISSASHRPMDMFEALSSGVGFDNVAWLTMGTYLDALKAGLCVTVSNDLDSNTATGFSSGTKKWI
jgi:hypothetical protein